MTTTSDGPEAALDSGRETQRVEFAMQVRVSDGRGESRSYLSRDLSEDGVFIRTSRPPAASGDAVQLEFVLPKLKAIKVRGEVASILSAEQVSIPGDAGMGIRFSDLAKADADALRTFLRDRGVR